MQYTTPHIEDIIERLPRNPQSPNRHTRPLGAIRYIVVHYDDEMVPPGAAEGGKGYDPVKRYKSQALYHMERNWNETGGPIVRGFGLMYHYRVSADGRLWCTEPEEVVTWHARAANYNGLAICCDLGQGQVPTQAQIAGLKSLLGWLCYHRPEIPAGRADVWGHGELRYEGNKTACPGELLPWVQAYRKGIIV